MAQVSRGRCGEVGLLVRNNSSKIARSLLRVSLKSLFHWVEMNMSMNLAVLENRVEIAMSLIKKTA